MDNVKVNFQQLSSEQYAELPVEEKIAYLHRARQAGRDRQAGFMPGAALRPLRPVSAPSER